VLGLGNIGPLASKPVMEGKAVLFKKFAGIDVFDIEVERRTSTRFVEVVAALEPTFGGINLEDIKAPECFEIEEQLKARMEIPVFHDDQHGTAIIVCAAVLNGLELAGKDIAEVKIVTPAPAPPRSPASTCWSTLGAQRENIWVTDLEGVVYKGRNTLMDRWKEIYAQETDARTLADSDRRRRRLPRPVGRRRAEAGTAGQADGPKPLILALANPNPEIMPEDALRPARTR
jgi:malate dehydrogenase (oxaloacetate-decarboxylating)(NADP+)